MNYFSVALGGAIGSVLRYWVVSLAGRSWGYTDFPWGTLIVNIVGCFLISFIGGWAIDKMDLHHPARLFFITGILGGFTTFSAFGYETFYYLKTSQFFCAIANVCANVILGIGAVVLGYLCARYLVS